MCGRAFAPALRLSRTLVRGCLFGRFRLGRPRFTPAPRARCARGRRCRSRLARASIGSRCGGARGRGLLLGRDALAPFLGAAAALGIVERHFFSRQPVQRTASIGLGAVDAAGDGERTLALNHRGVVAGLRRCTFGRQLFAPLRILNRSIDGHCGKRRQAA
jgi:hypothetical protein